MNIRSINGIEQSRLAEIENEAQKKLEQTINDRNTRKQFFLLRD